MIYLKQLESWGGDNERARGAYPSYVTKRSTPSNSSNVKCILITRPLLQGLKTKAKLEKLGHSCKLMPLLEIKYKDFAITGNYDYYIISSQNAACALVNQGAKKKPIFVVGKKSCEFLQQNGYEVAFVAPDATSLFAMIIKNSPNVNGMYLCGDHQAFPMAKKLNEIGIKTDTLEVYESIAIPCVSLPKVKTVLFYSTRTARIFAESCKSSLAGVTAICISRNTAKEIDNLGFEEVKIANHPDEKSIIELL